MDIKISASILSADFANLENDIKLCEDIGVDFIHIDVMDGLFVPNLTIGPCVISSLRKRTKLIFDAHLMISSPEKYIKDFIDAGCDIITIHIEAVENTRQVLEKIKSYDVKCGISLKPSTSEEKIYDLLDIVDLVLVMTVEPGFSGQEFMESQLSKIKNIRKMINQSKREIMLEVDGGINECTSKLAINAGANILVSGGYIFQDKIPKNTVLRLQKIRN